jgi:hypothetical protein
MESEMESEIEPETELGIGLRSRVQLGDPVIEKAQKSTQKARAKMVQKYSKRHDIQHFEIGDIVSIKVPREDRTATDNRRRLFGRVLEEPYSHRYKILTYSCHGDNDAHNVMKNYQAMRCIDEIYD